MRKIKDGIDVKNEYFAGEIGVTLYPPIVTVKNDLFPPHEELRNCTTCKYGRPLPADKLSNADYHYHCTQGVGGGTEHIGVDIKHLDNDCETFVRKRKEELNLDIRSLR